METLLFGSIALFWLVFVVIGIATSVFWIIEIVDIARREFPDPTMKIVWLLVVLFSHIIGALVYFFVGRPMGTLPGQYAAPPRPTSPPDQWPPPPTL